MSGSFEYDDNSGPGRSVVLIEARWGNTWYTGSGFLAGRNDVITAAHVVYAQRSGGYADEVRITLSFDPDEPMRETVRPVGGLVFTDFDPDGDGWLTLGDGRPGTMAGMEKDVALLSLSAPVGDRYGWLGINWGFTSGPVAVFGHPAVYGRQPTADTGWASRDATDNVLSLGADLEINGGNSGGPILSSVGGTLLAAGVVSTRIGATALSGHQGWLSGEMAANDLIIGVTHWGGTGADRLLGTAAGDILHGNRGDDLISGLGGVDTSVHTGSRSQYAVTQLQGTPTFRITGPDGSDTLSGIERLRFTDGEVTAIEAAAASTQGAVHRLFNHEKGTHLFTSSAQEAGSLSANAQAFGYEGLAFRGVATGPAAVEVYRLYNRDTGAHLLTASLAERDSVLRERREFLYEGVAFQAYDRDLGPQEEVYRFLNTGTGTHFFTTSEAERDQVVRTLPQFRYEGVAFFVDTV